MERNKGLLLGLALGLVLAIAMGGTWKRMSRYSTEEAINRAVIGYPRMETRADDNFNTVSDTASTDTTGLWWPTRGAFGSGGRTGTVMRFAAFHVARWRWEYRSTANDDAVCTLYVFSGGVAGTIDSGQTTTCMDTMVVPAPNFSGAVSGVHVLKSDWIPVALDSLLAVPSGATDSVGYFAVQVVGDTF